MFAKLAGAGVMLLELQSKEGCEHVASAGIIGITEQIGTGSTNRLLEKCWPYDCFPPSTAPLLYVWLPDVERRNTVTSSDFAVSKASTRNVCPRVEEIVQNYSKTYVITFSTHLA